MTNKQIKQLIVTVAMLLICIVAYVALVNYGNVKKSLEEDASEKENKSKATIICEIKSVDDITEFSYITEEQKIMLYREGEDTWLYKGDDSIDVDENVVESDMLAKIAYIKSEVVIESPEDINAYGFDKPTNNIVLKLSDGTVHTIMIGAQNEFDTGKYYMMVEGDNNVYVVDSVIPNAFCYPVEDLTEKESVTTDTKVE